jgi:hypothetical protein
MSRLEKIYTTGKGAKFNVQSRLYGVNAHFNLDKLVRKRVMETPKELEGYLSIYHAGGHSSKVRAETVPITATLSGGTSPKANKRVKIGERWYDAKVVNKDYVRPGLSVSIDYSSILERTTDEGRGIIEELADRVETWQENNPTQLRLLVKMYEACFTKSLAERIEPLREERQAINAFMVLSAVAAGKLTWGKYERQGDVYVADDNVTIPYKIADLDNLMMMRLRSGRKTRGGKLGIPVWTTLTRKERRPGEVTIISGGEEK